MRPPTRQRPRRGSILPIVAMLLPILCSFTALALDLGILAVSRTNCQSAADSAALVATRTLDNKTVGNNSNQALATTAAIQDVADNKLATQPGNPNTTVVEFGLYKYYDSTNPPPPPPPGAPAYANPGFNVTAWYPAGTALPNGEKSWTASRVTVTANQVSLFSSAMGVTNLNSYAYAVAVYRPRDIAMTLDMTGSMKFGCTARGNESFLSCDPLYPQAGHFARYPGYTAPDPGAGTNVAGAPSGRHNPFFTKVGYNWGQVYAPHNYTVKNAGGPAAVLDFYYDPANVASPATSVATPTVANLKQAFHHWTPPEINPGNPDAYVAATNDYSSWSTNTTATTANTFSVYPTPEFFKDQTDSQWIGDRYPRKRGAERLPSPGPWDPTAANGATYALAEYLGWTDRYASGDPTSTTAGFGVPGTSNAGAGLPKTRAALPAATSPTVLRLADYKADWSDFRDATWEKYGYDLDVNRYVTTRPATWDPGIDPELAAPTLPTQPRGYPAGDSRRAWWSTNKSAPSNPLVTDGRFKGYTMGPGYWGKSFFMWPPDPRAPSGTFGTAGYVAGDWRRRFYFKTDAPANAAITASQLDPAIDNQPAGGGTLDSINEVLLRNGVGETNNLPGGTNQINYRAVLAWVKQPPMCLPPNLRAGRVVYYTSIPDDVDTSSGSADVQKDKAFWKAYIDYVLNNKVYVDNGVGLTQYENVGWPEGATPAIYQNSMGQYDIDAAGTTPADPIPYMNYLDNPSRPRTTHWFGPITMMALLGSSLDNGLNRFQNAWAGTVHETQTWQLKVGVNSVLDDIRKNHPNDNVGLSYFCTEQYGFTSVGCSQDFKLLQASLFYPKPLVEDGTVWTDPTKEFRAFDTSMNWLGFGQVNNAQNGTDPNSGLASCFNILAPVATGSTNPLLPTLPPAPYGTASVARRGRRGASKIVIFETDGVPNNTSTANFQTQGYNSYYAIDVSTSPGGSANGMALAVVDQMVKPIAATTSGDSGLSSPSSPAKVYAIGFGDLFGISPEPSAATGARAFLLQVQQHGGTSGASDTGLPAQQIITGPYQTRINSLKTAFERILQSGVQVTLVE